MICETCSREVKVPYPPACGACGVWFCSAACYETHNEEKHDE